MLPSSAALRNKIRCRLFSSIPQSIPHINVRQTPMTGRFSNSGMTITVFGSYGFVGRYVVEEIAQSGARVYAPFRGCEMEVRHLKPMFDLGQLGLLPFSPRDEDSIRQSLEHSDIVVNLIGKHYETKHVVPTRREDGSLSRVNYDFEEVHTTIPRTLAKLSREAGVEHFIHFSAMSADPNSSSKWCRSKAHGEVAVREEFQDSIIIRPATVFGPEDRFLNLVAEVGSRLPFYPLFGDGKARVQPVYCVDIGKAVMRIINNIQTLKGTTIQLAGPAEYTYKELAEFVSDVTFIRQPLVSTPHVVASLAAKVLNNTISPIFTEESLTQMYEDNVARKDPTLLNFSDLGIDPASVDKKAFDYLHRFRPGGHFNYVRGYY